MVKFLLFLLLFLTKAAYGQSCYCTTAWSVNSTGQSYCTANADCWACKPGAYATSWQSLFCSGYVPPAPTCQYSAVTEERPCSGANMIGSETWKRENNCVNNTSVDSGWFKVASSCQPAPPTCKTSVESKIDSCQTGYTGAISSLRSSLCPDPYGQPVWTPWSVTSNTCVKELTNPTNTLSPISPTSVVTPPTTTYSTPSITVTPTIEMPVLDTTPSETPSSQPQSQPASVTSSAPSQESSAPSSTAGNTVKSLSLVQRLDTIGAIKLQPQPSLTINLITMQQELDENVRRQQDFLIDLIANDVGYDIISGDQRLRLGRILWSNPIQSSYGSD